MHRIFSMWIQERLTAERETPTLPLMRIELTLDQKAFARQAVEHGRLSREEDAVLEALQLWEERERSRAQILAAVDRAEASLARGEGRIITEDSMRDLAAKVNQHGRERLAASQAKAR